ncbi:hypothetical protein LTR10_003946 [Elasticomyces elasticus]|nr:hypothetical protein LTR10_003946 [Elasticomyces elasticus]KAK4977867.1 hypothetical protein LTR42_002242 [Elasticomyces elasticus]
MANRITISSLLNPVPAIEHTPSTAQPQTPATTPAKPATEADFWASGPILFDGKIWTSQMFDPTKKYPGVIPKKNTWLAYPPRSILPDSILFKADPRVLTRTNLLRLALHNSNEEIFEKANADRPVPTFPSVGVVGARILQARQWYAKQIVVARQSESQPEDSQLQSLVMAEEVKMRKFLKEARIKNGVGRKRTAEELDHLAEDFSKRCKTRALETHPLRKSDW